MEKLEQLAKTMQKKGYRATCCDNREDARKILLSEVKQGETVGIGGSVTVQELDILDALAEKGCVVHWHWLPTENAAQTRKLAAGADVYLCSTNAVTEAGELVNIDGTGNRVAAMVFGPGRNIIVISKNKITSGLDAAQKRVKEIACPKNALRLSLSTPCALTGKCNDCDAKDRMCNVTTIISSPPGKRDMHILLVNEDMGY